MAQWVGIDIGTNAIKVAVLKTAYRKVSLVGLATVPVGATGPVLGIEEPTMAGAPALASLVRTALETVLPKAGGFDGCATSLPGVQATFKNLALPASAQKQIAGVMPYELESLVPFDLEDAVFDYRVLAGIRALPGADTTTVPVLAAVARVGDVRGRIDVVKEATGVEPERVGVGPLPLANLLPYLPMLGEDATIILDLGLRQSDLLVVRAGEPEFARTLSCGTEGLPHSAPRLAREIRTTLAAYRATGGPPPTRVLLCGGGAFQPGAESFLGSRSSSRWSASARRRSISRSSRRSRSPSFRATPRRSASRSASTDARSASIFAAVRSPTNVAIAGCARRFRSWPASARRSS